MIGAYHTRPASGTHRKPGRLNRSNPTVQLECLVKNKLLYALLAAGLTQYAAAQSTASKSAENDAENGLEQQQPDSSAQLTPRLELDTIVVSATRTERPLFTTPAAVFTLRREEIQSIQPYGYQDVFEAMPSVSIQGGPRRIAEEPSIRGFADEQVVIRIDGTRQNFNQAHRGRFPLDPDLIRSAEVLRGASSAVYGSGALGGVFVLETVNGRDLTGGRNGVGLRVKGGYQSNGEEWSSFNTAYGQWDSVDALASFVYRDVGEDLEDGDDDPILASQDETINGLVKLGWEPNEHSRLEIAVDHFDNSGRNPPNANSPATATNLVDRDTERTNGRIRYQHHNPANRWINLDATIYNNEVDVREFRLDDGRIDRTDFETSGLELVNTSEIAPVAGDAIKLTYGLEFYEDEQSGTRNGADRLQFPDAEVDYRAGFVQAETPLPGHLSLIPGVRFDSFEYSAEQEGFPDRDEDEFSPRVALGWQPVESIYLWAEYAQAFRAPSLTELFADGVHFTAPLGPGQVVINEFVPTPNLKPEESEQFQLGARLQRRNLFGSDFELDVEANYHHSDVDNFVDQRVIFISGEPSFDPITQTLVFPGITTNFNVDAEIQGFEASARLSNDHVYVQAALATLDSEVDGGGELAGIQPNQASLSAGFHTLQRQLTIGAELTAAEDRSDVPEGALQTPGYGKTDVFVNYLPNRGPLDGFEFRLAVDNVFNKDFRIHPNAIDQPGRSVRVTIATDLQWLQ